MKDERFKLEIYDYTYYFIDTKQEYIDQEEIELKLNGYVTMSNEQILTILNKYQYLQETLKETRKENEWLKRNNKYYEEVLNDPNELYKRSINNIVSMINEALDNIK